MAQALQSCSMAALLLGHHDGHHHGHHDAAGRHVSMLQTALESIELRSETLATHLSAAEAEVAVSRARLAETQDCLASVSAQLESSATEQQAQRREVSRLTALLEAAQLQAALTSEQLAADLEDERLRSERLRAVRDDALLQRDNALLELADAFTDIHALQATLADSALYVRQLRRRITDLELTVQHQQQQSQQQRQQQQRVEAADRQRDQDEGVFSMASIKAAVEAAVAAAAEEPELERKRRIRQLQLRWHPDKNPVLREVATEVTKLINEAVSKLEAKQG